MSFSVRVKEALVLSLPALRFAVLEFIYEKKTMRVERIRQMQESMVRYSQCRLRESVSFEEYRKLKHKQRFLEEDELEEIKSLAWLLQKNEEGAFEDRKRLFKEKKVDWKKFHRLPGSNSPQEVAAARAAYQEYARKNQEQESYGVNP